MPDKQKLNTARALYEQAKYPEARKMLEEITTKDPAVRLDVLATMIVLLDHATENDKLLAVANEGVELASKSGSKQVENYFLGKKCLFLLTKLSNKVYRKTNLTLSGRVFEWQGFSLVRDKKEYETLEKECAELEAEIETIIVAVSRDAEQSANHNFRGHQFSTLGDVFSSKHLLDKLEFQEGGRLKSGLASLYMVRRWNLDRFLYSPEARHRIDKSRDNCVRFFELAIKEFELAETGSEQAHAMYNLAVKYKTFNRFRLANKLLAQARVVAESVADKRLLDKIDRLAKELVKKNKNLRDYVGEMGLDLPEGSHPSI